MSSKRGVLIALEGLDKSGKTTQSEILRYTLEAQDQKVLLLHFPDRTTPVGKILGSYLRKEIDLTPRVSHLLFSANRWEIDATIREAINRGTTVLVDRYVASGVAYSRAISLPTDWCEQPDKGLLKPDLTIWIHVGCQAQKDRGGWGDERYDNIDLQRRVSEAFKSVADHTWAHVDGEFEKEIVAMEVLKLATAAINLYSSTLINVF